MNSQNALQIYNNKSPDLSFGCKVIDSIIGKIKVGGITEIAGEAGSGKTQICLSLSLNCQLSIEDGGMNGGCAYLSCGEGEFPIRRLSQLATFYQKKSSIPISHSKFLEQIYIEKCYCSNDAIETISSKLPLMCQTQGVKLLVIDSLAGLVRTEFDVKDKNEIIDRTKFLFRLAQSLKWLADTFKICIIVLNQVTANDFGQVNNFVSNKFSDLKPALGLAWTTCVNTRIMLYRDTTAVRSINTFPSTEKENSEYKDSIENTTMATVKSNRLISLEFSPLYGKSLCYFNISVDGICGFL